MAQITSSTIPLGNKPYASAYYSIGIERCHNMFLENSATDNAKTQYYLLKIAGMKRYGSINTTNLGGCRCLMTTGTGRTFGVWGSGLYEVYVNGFKSSILGTLNSTNGPVQIADNGLLLMIVDGVNGYIFRLSDNNFQIIADEYFPGIASGTEAPTHVLYQDTRFIVNVPNSNEYYWSNSYYKYTGADDYDHTYDTQVTNGYWTPLQMAQKMAVADNIMGIGLAKNMIWVFGYNSMEVHYDTGNYESQLYARYEGTIVQIGCRSKYTIAYLGDNVAWLGADKSGNLAVYTNDGIAIKKISTRGIEQIIGSFTKTDDAIGFIYTQASHTFYVLHFPTADRTFVFDYVTDSWHERTYMNPATGSLHMHRSIYVTFNFNAWISGHYSHSTLFTLDYSYYVNDNPGDNGVNYIRCEKTSPIAFANGNNVRYNAVQVMFAQGTGLIQNNADKVGIDPTVWVQWSDDAGNTWSSQRPAKIGKIGEYAKRSRILGCGMGRNRVWDVVVTDPVSVLLIGLIVESLQCRF